MEKELQGKDYTLFIGIVSIAVPLLVVVLFYTPSQFSVGEIAYSLPHLNALINSLTSLLLIGALIAIKSNNRNVHRYLMTSAVVLGALFLISYVIYHSSVDSVIYGDANKNGILEASEAELVTNRPLYLGILLSHIGLSVITIPLVLFALMYAIKGQFTKHKKMVKYAYPVWLYVSITGVLVYMMMRPYYF